MTLLRSMAGLALWLGHVGFLEGQEVPTITRLKPLAFTPGETTRVTISGTGLSGAQPLWTSIGTPLPLAGHVENNGQLQDHVVFEGTLPAEISQGLQTLRVVTPGGATAQRLFLVDDLPPVEQGTTNISLEQAQAISSSCGVDGLLGNLERRFYQFEVTAKQRVAFEVYARRLGSQLDPLLVLYDARGNELAACDDVPGLGGDAQLTHRFEAAGSYIVEVRDIRYRGGNDFFYWLRLGDFPCLQATYPLAVQRGLPTELEFAGLEAVAIAPRVIEALDAHAVHSVSVQYPNGTIPSYATLLVGDRPEQREVEPNNTPEQATTISLAGHINGRLQSPGDIDWFQFPVAKGDRFEFSGMTRSEGAPTDLQMQLFDASGRQLAIADDNGPEEGRIEHTFAEAGDFRLAVSDVAKRGGAAYVYRVTVNRFVPTFRLAIDGDGLNVPAGGTALLPVQVTRLGNNNAIELHLEQQLPDGWTCQPTVIGAGQTQGFLSVTAPASPGSLLPLDTRLVGTSLGSDPPLQVVGDCSRWLTTRWHRAPIIPPAVRETISITSAAPSKLNLTIEPTEVVFGPQMTGSLTIRVQRGEGVAGDVTLATLPEKEALPKEIGLELKPIPAAADHVTLQFTATENAPLGRFSLALVGTLKQDQATYSASPPVINYRLAAPFELSFGEASPLSAGHELQIPVTLRRNPAFSGAATVTINGLPEGVTAAPLTLPDNATAGALVLRAGSDLQPTTLTGLKAVVTATDNPKLTHEVTLPDIAVVRAAE